MSHRLRLADWLGQLPDCCVQTIGISSSPHTQASMAKALNQKEIVRLVSAYSLPLIFGVVVAMVAANVVPGVYDHLVHSPIYALHKFPDSNAAASDHHADDADHGHHAEHEGHHDVSSHGDTHEGVDATAASHHSHNAVDQHADEVAGHAAASHASAHHDVAHHADQSDHHGGHGGEHSSPWAHILTMHFLVNDIFMVLFFGVAAKEITEACLPGGALNPPSKAINPLCGTLGGVLGPVGVFFGLNALFGEAAWSNGWGIPTATDIALAWLVAKLIFGNGHPAISFLLLLAVADDAIGLGIIALAYPDPAHPTEWMNALWIVPGMFAAYTLRRLKVASWIPYVAIGGAICWWGLYSAHLHPALALVFVVPFIPGPMKDLGLYTDYSDEKYDDHNSPLENFEHQTRLVVDFGLFFFAFANAGVPLQGVSTLTWIVLASLIAGKMIGITLFSWGAQLVGFALPTGMNVRHLLTASAIAGLGLTVALFVSGQAFTDASIQGAAKMGALLSVLVGPLAYFLALLLGVANVKKSQPKLQLATNAKE